MKPSPEKIDEMARDIARDLIRDLGPKWCDLIEAINNNCEEAHDGSQFVEWAFTHLARKIVTKIFEALEQEQSEGESWKHADD